ncbi:PD-(D/E)XK nuclease family protein, partial [bacterium]|nr:PD-(D/E)XK nuclease family protein [bacterium]
AYDIESEIEWGKSSLDLLRSYYELEDPRKVTTPNPLVKEMWVQARLPTLSSEEEEEEFIELKGKIDRIDVLPNNPSSDDRLQLQIIDYKTGKKPNFKYSKSVNDRISNEQFWKMKVYALMLYKMISQTDALSQQPNDQEGYKYAMPWTLQQRLKQALTNNVANTPDWGSVLELNSLRLMYLTSHLDDDSINDSNTATSGTGKAACLDYPLMGSQSSEIVPFLNEMELEVQTIAKDIKILVDQQDPHAFKHCDWRYCSCHELRRRFRPGSVYQSPELDA